MHPYHAGAPAARRERPSFKETMIYRLIPSKWLNKPILEGKFTAAQIRKYNAEGYNIYYFPNYPSNYKLGTNVVGRDVDVFNWVFVDCDLKDKRYASPEAFLEKIASESIGPTKIVESGNGIHVYWRVANLDAKSYLRFQRRLVRLFDTDPATCMLNQLMRVPGTFNTKDQVIFKPCSEIYSDDVSYTAEELDKRLPPITAEDEAFVEQHYTMAYNPESIVVSDELPPKFGKFLAENPEAKELFTTITDDRSKADFRLGHLMFAYGFTKDEAMSVLVNSVKALERSPIHRQSYAKNIVDKIWTFESTEDKSKLDLSSSVKDILQRSGTSVKGTPFRCHPRIDNTDHGFRLGQVIGLVAGSGVGKTAFALNMFKWCTEANPDYHHLFIPLEQPANEIADRWKTMCGDDTSLHDKVHIMSNYDENGNFRHLSLGEIREYVEKFQKVTGNKIGCIVIDHIGALKKKGKDGENQDLMDICHAMKAFAIQTNTLLVMQSQTSRDKAGIGDLELNKDAAYGTMYFEAYCDYLITIWQPLKRCHSEEACPTVTAFKFCKIRHKKSKKDVIQEDVCYYMYFDSETEQMRDMTQDEKTAFDYFLPKSTNKRKMDRKTELLNYTSVPYKAGDATRTNSN